MIDTVVKLLPALLGIALGYVLRLRGVADRRDADTRGHRGADRNPDGHRCGNSIRASGQDLATRRDLRARRLFTFYD
jgi:hypothetical protein